MMAVSHSLVASRDPLYRHNRGIAGTMVMNYQTMLQIKSDMVTKILGDDTLFFSPALVRGHIGQGFRIDLAE